MDKAHAAADLSEKLKEVLRLTSRGYEAKEIAQELGISPHAVNERLRDARRKLGASTSKIAARQLAIVEGQPTYNRVVDKPIGVEPPAPPMSFSSSSSNTGMARRDGGFDLHEDQAPYYADASQDWLQQMPLPFPTSGRPRNELTTLQTVGWVSGLALMLAFVGIAAIAIVNQLSQLASH
jgi:DNA-binding CsgD family transcriptional regulator